MVAGSREESLGVALAGSPTLPASALQLPYQMLKILRRRAIGRDSLARSRMNKLKIRGVQRDSVNQLLFSFFAVIFSVADERMPNGGKLRANLVLQSGDKFHAYKCRVGKGALYCITQFGAGSVGITGRPQLLIHAFTPEIMHQRA